jgi:hypothetical protein
MAVRPAGGEGSWVAASAPRWQGPSSRDRALAIAVSATGHVAVFVFLLWHLHWRGESEGPAAMEVELARPLSPEPRSRPRRPEQALRPTRIAPPSASLSRPVETRPPTTPSPGEAAAPVGPPSAEPLDLAKALRGSLGCGHSDYLRMSPAERQACETRMADRSGLDGPAFGIDPRKRAAFDLAAKKADFLQEPFLAERPTKGCKPRVFEHESGGVGRAPPNWTASVACAVRF